MSEDVFEAVQRKLIARKLAYLEKTEQQSKVSETQLAEAFQEIRISLESGTLKTMKLLVDKYVQQIDIYPDRIVVKFNFFPHLRPDIPNDTNDQEGHSETECPSFVGDGVPDSMTVDAQRTAFSTGDDANFVWGMKIINRLRK